MENIEEVLDSLEIDFISGCWNWTRNPQWKAERGYRKASFGRKEWRAHRLVYTLIVNPIPEGFELHHTCRNKSCCNPDHLELVTKKEHPFIDVSPFVKNLLKTHCPQGHEYTPENTYQMTKDKIHPNGGRICRTCQLARANERYRKKKAGLLTK